MAAHWPRDEKSGDFDQARLAALLAEEIEVTELSGEEKGVWLDGFIEKLGRPRDSEKAFFNRWRRRRLGFGLDVAGKLVRKKPDDDA